MRQSADGEQSDSGPAIALITGAGRGVGAAIAETLAATHDLILLGRPSEHLEAVASTLAAEIWPLDLTDYDAVTARAEKLEKLDVLVHNAGVAFPGRFAESTAAEWQTTFDVNVTGAAVLTLALLPALRSARGQVIFINSGAGFTVSPGLTSYSASKFAQRGLADALRNDEPLLRVTSVHPGRIDTAMQRDLVAYEGRQYNGADFLAPETVARVVAEAVNAPADAHVHEVVVRPRGRIA